MDTSFVIEDCGLNEGLCLLYHFCVCLLKTIVNCMMTLTSMNDIYEVHYFSLMDCVDINSTNIKGVLHTGKQGKASFELLGLHFTLNFNFNFIFPVKTAPIQPPGSILNSLHSTLTAIQTSIFCWRKVRETDRVNIIILRTAGDSEAHKHTHIRIKMWNFI